MSMKGVNVGMVSNNLPIHTSNLFVTCEVKKDKNLFLRKEQRKISEVRKLKDSILTTYHSENHDFVNIRYLSDGRVPSDPFTVSKY